MNPSVTAGVSQRFTATGTFSDNSTQQLASATWSTSDNTLAMVTSDVTNYGTAFGVAQGSPTVSACMGSICGSTTLTVASQTALPPGIQGLAPGSGTLGSWVAISGTNFGAAQGSSTISFGGAAATVVGWSDTAIFAVVPNTLTVGQTVSVIVTTSAGGSNPADFLPVSTTAPYNVSPQEVNLLVGQTRTISVTDSSGNALTGLEWTTSNASVASLSTDDPPIVTAVAPGTAVVYVVGMPILVTVYSGTSLPTGTAIWSVPMGGGGGPGSVTIAPAVPSASGVDVFALDTSGMLTALSADGGRVWKARGGAVIENSGPIDTPFVATSIIPDFSGSALLKSDYGFADSQGWHQTHLVQQVDSATGQLTNLYTFSAPFGFGGNYFDDAGSTQAVIPHPSGMLFIQDNATVSVLNPSTAQQVAGIAVEASNFNDIVYPPQVGSMIVAGDGNAYLPYTYFSAQGSSESQGTVDAQSTSYLNVLRVSPDGSYAKVPLGNWTGNVVAVGGNIVSCTGSFMSLLGLGSGNGLLPVITNAGTGATVFANLGITPACGGSEQTFEQMSFVSQNGLSSQVNVQASAFVPTLQREDGSYIGTDGGNNLIALGLDGSVVWQQSTYASSAITPLYATADGGAIATSTSQCPTNVVMTTVCTPQLGTLYTVDQNGNVTSQTPDTGATPSWTNQWYVDPQTVTVSATSQPPVDFARAWAALRFGNHSRTSAAILQQWFPPLKSCYGPNGTNKCANGTYLPGDSVLAGIIELQTLVAGPCIDWLDHKTNACAKYVFNKLGAPDDQQRFAKFLTRIPGFFDGTTSTFMIDKLTGDMTGLDAWDLYAKSQSPKISVAEAFATPLPGGIMIQALAFPDPKDAQSAVGKRGPGIFFRPSAICTDYLNPKPGSTCRVDVQSLLFHESLHDFYGFTDTQIQLDFGIPVIPCTADISDWISYNIFGRASKSCVSP